MKRNSAIFLAATFIFTIFPSAIMEKAFAATPSAPTITAVEGISGGLSVSFTAPTGVTPEISNYEYSVDGGSSWVSPETPITGSPFAITGLVDCQTYLISIRAVNDDGAGEAATGWNGVPGALDYHLNNGLMKFGSIDYDTGSGEVESILSNGNLRQPWYKSGNGSWSKLTFGDNPLSYGLGVGGDGSAEWNIEGDYEEVLGSLTNLTIDCSQFIETNRIENLSIGYGKLIVTGRATIGTREIEITRSYSQTATSKYTIFNESIKNIGNTSLTNARAWFGTRDDYIGQDDVNTKRRGNIVNGVFEEILNTSTQSKVLEVTNTDDAVYFYTTSNLGYTTGLNGYGNFKNEVMNQDPVTAPTSVTNDGSYGMYLRFQDIAPGASESFTWYYIASTKEAAAALLGNVASAALPGVPTVNSVTAGDSKAAVDFTEGTSGGSAITNYQYSTDGGSTWQTRSPAGTTSPLQISGLANGTTYNVQLRAINSEGVGTATTSTEVTPVGPPPAPLITEIEQTETSVSIAFSQQDTGGSPITNYQYSRDGGLTWVTPNPAVTTSPIVISGLTRGTNYEFALRAVNSAGPGVSSAIQEATTLDLPQAPTIGSIVTSNQALSVPFTVGDNGGTPISNIEYSLDGGASWVTRSPASTYSPLVIQNLTNGQSYAVAIRAVNAVGHSTASNSVTAIPKTVPGAISLPVGTNVTPSNEKLTVNFTAPNNGGSAITSYEYSTDRGTTWRTRTDSGSTSSPIEITKLSSDGTTSLTNGIEYCIQLRAVNAVGAGVASNDVCSTPKTVPDAPSLSLVTSRDRALDVSYTVGGNGGSPITGIEYCITTCSENSNWIFVSSTSSPLRIAGLLNGTGYTVNLRTVNSVGSSAADVADSPVTPASNPSAPIITSISTSSRTATIVFNAPTSDGGVSISNYEYSTNGGATWRGRTDSTGTTTTLIVTKQSSDGTTPLTNGLSYELAIRAVTASTVGLASSSIFATPSTTPSAPTNGVFTVFNSRIVVGFDAASDGGSPITNYEYALSTNGGISWGNYSPANILTPGFTITNLVNGTAYKIKIRALNSRGAGEELISESTYTPTGVPDSPLITATSNSRLTSGLTDKQIQVTFTEPANNGSPITNYQYSTDNGVTWRDRTDGTGRFSPLVISKLSTNGTTDLSVDTAYEIKIRAKNANGAGDESAMTSARTGGAVDNVAPTVTITSSAGTESTSRTLTYSVVFSETIQGLDRTDFVKASGTATCSVSAVSASLGTNFTVTVVCSTDGTYRLRLNANTVTDGTNLGPVDNQDVTTVTVDTMAPSAELTTASNTSGSLVLTYTSAFSSTVTGISISDFYQVSGTSSCTPTAVSAASGNSVTLTVTCTSDGTVVMGLRADSVVRSGMTGPVNAVEAETVTIDSSIPTATVSLESINSDKTILVYEVTFSEVVSDISLTDFVQASGSASCRSTAVTASSGNLVKFTVTCTTGGTLQMNLLSRSVTDGTNLAPVNALQTSVQSVGPIVATPTTIDSIVPTATIASPNATSRTRSLSYTVTFSESVSDIATLDFVKVQGTAQCSTSSASQVTGKSVTFRVNCTSDGTIVMHLLAKSVTDGTNLGPIESIAAREVTVRTQTQGDGPTPTTSIVTPTPQPSSTSQSVSRNPVLIDGVLPEVRTSTSVTTVGGEKIEAKTELLDSGRQQLVLPNGVTVSIDVKLRSKATTSSPAKSGLLTLAKGDGLVVDASGLQPGTEVAVWLFSTPRLLGTAIVDQNGSINSTFNIGSDIPTGQHTAQVSGLNTKGEIVTVNTGVEVVASTDGMNNWTPAQIIATLLAASLVIFVMFAMLQSLLRKRKN